MRIAPAIMLICPLAIVLAACGGEPQRPRNWHDNVRRRPRHTRRRRLVSGGARRFLAGHLLHTHSLPDNRGPGALLHRLRRALRTGSHQPSGDLRPAGQDHPPRPASSTSTTPRSTSSHAATPAAAWTCGSPPWEADREPGSPSGPCAVYATVARHTPAATPGLGGNGLYIQNEPQGEGS